MKIQFNNFDDLRKRWELYLIGPELNTNSDDVQIMIASIEHIVAQNIGYQSKEDESSSSYIAAYCTLRALAMAYRTPGTKYYKKPEIGHYLISELQRLHDIGYNLNTPQDNWWAVEVGIPLHLLDILVLMYDELPDCEGLIRTYTDVILNCMGAYTKTSNGMMETGANLVWKCSILMLTGILRKEQQHIDWVNAHLPLVLRYASTKKQPGMEPFYDDGFYPDGSFLQHYFFAYTGGYGKHLISILSGILYVYQCTGALTLSDEEQSFLHKMVFDAYEPLIYNGRFMDIARGRESSRYFYEDHICGRHVMRALCYLSETMPEPARSRTRSMVKEWLLHSGGVEGLLTDVNGFAEYFVQGSLIPIVREIMSSTVTPRGELLLHKTFGVMTKAVHHGRGFGLAVSMYGANTAAFEYLNGESQKFWHMSDGVTYLYTADADQYNGNFYATVDMQRLPGITVDRSPTRENDPYFSWYLPEARNVYAFAGGSDMDCYGIAGLQYCGQGIGKTRDLEVKKSWFMFDDEIVALGSGITSTTGNSIETIVDNKRLMDGSLNLITINTSAALPCAKLTDTYADTPCKQVNTLHITGNKGKASDIGYYFPDAPDVNILCEHRVGTWNSVEIDLDFMCENDFITFWLPHGEKPADANYAYVILPCKSAEETRCYVADPDIEILENTTSAHAVKETKMQILGVNFWNATPYTCCGITCSSQSSVMMKTIAKGWELAVSDPTKTDQEIELSFDFNATSVVQQDYCIEVIGLEPLKLRIDTKNTHGQSLRCKIISM